MYSNNKISILIPSLAVTSSSSSPNRVQLQKGGQIILRSLFSAAFDRDLSSLAAAMERRGNVSSTRV